MRSARQPISFAGLDAYEEPALAARAHRHVAVDEERKTAEHALLGQPAFVREQAPHPVGKILVERHTRSVGAGLRHGDRDVPDSWRLTFGDGDDRKLELSSTVRCE